MGELAGLTSAAAWALSTVFMRAVSSAVPLLWVNTLRCSIGALWLVAFALATPQGPERILALPLLGILWLLASTVISNGLGDNLYLRATQLIGVARTMPLSGSFPVFSLAIGVGLLGEPITPMLVVGTVLVLVGVYLVAVPRGEPVEPKAVGSGTGARAGIILAVAAAFCYAVNIFLSRLALEVPNVDVASGNLVRMAGAGLFGLGLTHLRPAPVPWRQLRPRVWLTLVAISLIGGALNPYLYLYSVQAAGVARAAVLNSTSPLFGLLLSILLLGERVTRQTGFGAVTATIGVWLIL